MSISEEFNLREDFSGLPLVLGLLGDWVSLNLLYSFRIPDLIQIQITNSKTREQTFFNYFNP